MRRTSFVGFVAAGCLMLAAGAAFASRTALDGRGLPRFLAADPSNLPYFPGGAGDLLSQILLDVSAGSRYELELLLEATDPSNRFALALFGRSVKFGYVLDGSTHNVVLGMPHGIGFILGFSDQYDETQRSTNIQFGDNTEQQFNYTKRSETQVRASLGWSGRLGDRRTIAIALAGSYLDSEIHNRLLRVVDGDTLEAVDAALESDPGLGWEVSLQSLDPEAGPLIAARYSDTDRNPNSDGVSAPVWRSRRALLDLAWRWTPEILDDLVFGWTSSWSKNESSLDPGYSSDLVEKSEDELWRGGVFVSGEKRLLDALIVRAGVLATGTFGDQEITYTEVSGDYSSYTTRSSSTGRIESPRISLGAGWSWKSLQADIQLYEGISLTSPFVRWSGTLFW